MKRKHPSKLMSCNQFWASTHVNVNSYRCPVASRNPYRLGVYMQSWQPHTAWSSQMILKYLILLVLVRHDQTWQEPSATSCRNVRRAKGLTWTKALSSIATTEANTDTLRVKANQEKIICVVLEACEEPCLAISTLYTVGCSHRPYQNTWEHPRTVYLPRRASVNK